MAMGVARRRRGWGVGGWGGGGVGGGGKVFKGEGEEGGSKVRRRRRKQNRKGVKIKKKVIGGDRERRKMGFVWLIFAGVCS